MENAKIIKVDIAPNTVGILVEMRGGQAEYIGELTAKNIKAVLGFFGVPFFSTLAAGVVAPVRVDFEKDQIVEIIDFMDDDRTLKLDPIPEEYLEEEQG
jgi:hypothetical protein